MNTPKFLGRFRRRLDNFGCSMHRTADGKFTATPDGEERPAVVHSSASQVSEAARRIAQAGREKFLASKQR